MLPVLPPSGDGNAMCVSFSSVRLGRAARKSKGNSDGGGGAWRCTRRRKACL
ncbi:hypothetical protein B0H19DRAFT_1123100 [Mycena capillaripes]|nr:hypothetical protein B0H19DRAFT_1123100 [Mycena capillaripes]